MFPLSQDIRTQKLLVPNPNSMPAMIPLRLFPFLLYQKLFSIGLLDFGIAVKISTAIQIPMNSR